MADENSVVSVNIDAQTASPIGLDFGTPLVVGFHTAFAERVRSYTSLQALVVDFATTTAIYRACAAIFSQNPRPPVVKVGRLTTGSVMVLTLTPTNVVNNRTYSLIINGTTVSFTADASATAAEIVTGLIAAVNGASLGITASGTTTLVLTANVAGVVFSCEYNQIDFSSQNTTPDTSGIAAQLAAIQLEDDNWYGVVMTSWGKAEIQACAAYCETQKKIFVACSNDADVLAVGTGDISSTLKGLNLDRTSFWFSRNPHRYLNAAILGLMLTYQPGSATWKFKTVAGVGTDLFSPSELSRLKSKNANYYLLMAAVGTTTEGVASSGDFVDTIMFVDWLQNDMQIAVFTALKALPKIPMTDAGFSVVRNAVQGSLKRGIAAGGIDGSDPDKVIINVPLARNMSQADRNARRLTGFTWSAPLAGAVHSTIIQGTLV